MTSHLTKDLQPCSGSCVPLRSGSPWHTAVCPRFVAQMLPITAGPGLLLAPPFSCWNLHAVKWCHRCLLLLPISQCALCFFLFFFFFAMVGIEFPQTVKLESRFHSAISLCLVTRKILSEMWSEALKLN